MSKNQKNNNRCFLSSHSTWTASLLLPAPRFSHASPGRQAFQSLLPARPKLKREGVLESGAIRKVRDGVEDLRTIWKSLPAFHSLHSFGKEAAGILSLYSLYSFTDP